MQGWDATSGLGAPNFHRLYDYFNSFIEIDSSALQDILLSDSEGTHGARELRYEYSCVAGTYPGSDGCLLVPVGTLMVYSFLKIIVAVVGYFCCLLTFCRELCRV